MNIDKIVKGHDIFRSLNVDETAKLSGFSADKKFKAGDVVFKYNGASSHVYMLMSGSVTLRLPAAGSDISFAISNLEKGELFGLSPLLGSKRYTSTAQCNSDVEVLAIEAKPLHDLLKENAPVGFDIMNQVARIYFARYIDVLMHFQGIVSQIPLIH